MQTDYGTKVISELGKHEYRVYFSMLSFIFDFVLKFISLSLLIDLANKNGDLISPLNDIPLWVDKVNGIANMIVEIPRGLSKFDLSEYFLFVSFSRLTATKNIFMSLFDRFF